MNEVANADIYYYYRIIVYTSVICATIPRLNQFLSTLQTGRATTQIPDGDIYLIGKTIPDKSSTIASRSS
jgi:hypothetical protein